MNRYVPLIAAAVLTACAPQISEQESSPEISSFAPRTDPHLEEHDPIQDMDYQIGFFFHRCSFYPQDAQGICLQKGFASYVYGESGMSSPLFSSPSISLPGSAFVELSYNHVDQEPGRVLQEMCNPGPGFYFAVELSLDPLRHPTTVLSTQSFVREEKNDGALLEIRAHPSRHFQELELELRMRGSYADSIDPLSLRVPAPLGQEFKTLAAVSSEGEVYFAVANQGDIQEARLSADSLETTVLDGCIIPGLAGINLGANSDYAREGSNFAALDASAVVIGLGQLDSQQVDHYLSSNDSLYRQWIDLAPDTQD